MMLAPQIPPAARELASAAVDGVNGAGAAAANLPWGADALAITGVLVGLALWLAGRKLLRPLFAVGAAGLLGALGFFGPASLGITFSPHLTMAIGAVAGALVGLFLFRFAMAVVMASTMAIVSPVVLAAIVGISASAGVAVALSPDQQLLEGVPIQGTSAPATPAVQIDEAAPKASSNTSTAARKVAAFMKQAYLELEDRWVQLPIQNRILLLGVAASGAAVGFLAGLLIPKVVALFATALLGPLIWAPCALSFANLHSVNLAAIAPGSAQSWLFVWLGLSAVGVVVQWTAFPGKADKRS